MSSLSTHYSLTECSSTALLLISTAFSRKHMHILTSVHFCSTHLLSLVNLSKIFTHKAPIRHELSHNCMSRIVMKCRKCVFLVLALQAIHILHIRPLSMSLIQLYIFLNANFSHCSLTRPHAQSLLCMRAYVSVSPMHLLRYPFLVASVK